MGKCDIHVVLKLDSWHWADVMIWFIIIITKVVVVTLTYRETAKILVTFSFSL